MNPTPDPTLTVVLHALMARAQAILGDHFVGAYLLGSFAVGDWDEDSDVDFLVVVERDLAAADVAALQAAHVDVYDRDDLDPRWARHLEGSYMPREILRRNDLTSLPLVYIDNGSRVFERSTHDNTLVVRWVMHEHGITLAGPAPQDLLDPVPPDALRHEVREKMKVWAAEVFAAPEAMNNRWYQPYAVLGYSRMLHTLHTGRVGSKWAGAEWAQHALDPQWADLIQRAWADRPNPSLKVTQKVDSAELRRTLDFIHYALNVAAAA